MGSRKKKFADRVSGEADTGAHREQAVSIAWPLGQARRHNLKPSAGILRIGTEARAALRIVS